MAQTKTKIVAALGALDLARQLATAYANRQKREANEVSSGERIRRDLASAARNARDKVSDIEWLPDHYDYNIIPRWRKKPTLQERVVNALPIVSIVGSALIAIVFVARWISRTDQDWDNNSRLKATIKAGSEAIDSGITKTIEGGSTAATETAAAVAAGSSAIKSAVVAETQHQVDERVVTPIKQKAVRIGIVGVLGLTAYVIVIAAAVQLVIQQFS